MCAPETRLPMLNIPAARRRRSRVAYLEDPAPTPSPSVPSAAVRDTVLALPSPDEANRTSNSSNPLKKTNRVTGRPLAVGVHVMCRWRDGNYRLAQIIERRKVDSPAKSQFEYYVHYVEFDRRLDEWVNREQFDLDASEKSVEQKVKAQVTGAKRARPNSRRIKDGHGEDGDLTVDPTILREHEKCTKVKNVAFIEIGRHKIETWYYSPLPPEFHNSQELYLCEFCLSFMKSREQLERHMRKCDLKHPPGNEIYRNGTLSMFEVDGKKNKVYCQNLCYMAKLFIDHKALCDEVHYFLFYVLCECDDSGCHMVAYFSKEKQSEHSCNLACILTLPPYQRKGYGKFLIAFSYELSKKEGKAGTPEKPLSDLGKLSYKGYWTRALLEILKKQDSEVSVRELSEKTAILPYDVFCTLKEVNLIQCNSEGIEYICTDHNVLDSHLRAAGHGGPAVDASKLMWTPYKEHEQEEEQEPGRELALLQLS